MTKIAFCLAAALSLSACLETTSTASVARFDTLSATCGSTHMQTMNGLPMRCGPQVAAPYTYR